MAMPAIAQSDTGVARDRPPRGRELAVAQDDQDGGPSQESNDGAAGEAERT